MKVKIIAELKTRQQFCGPHLVDLGNVYKLMLKRDA